MKDQLALCSLALNPNAPSPTASMVKVEDGHVTAFGGQFCIRAPLDVEVGACFNPKLAAVFFRKSRKAVAYTVEKGKITFKEGKEKLKIPCLNPEEMVTIDVLAEPSSANLDMTHYRSVLEVVNPANNRIWAQGVTFKCGMMQATNNTSIVAAISGLEDDLEFNLPIDAAKALTKFKSQVTGVALDERAAKFYFKDGASLTSLLLPNEFPDVSAFFGGEWVELSLKDPEDLHKLNCKDIGFDGGTVFYRQEDKSTGELEGYVNPEVAARVDKEIFDILLGVSHDIRATKEGNRLMAVAETCRAVCATHRYNK